MEFLLPAGGVVSRLEVAWLVGVEVQVLEVYLGAKLPALLVLSPGCFPHIFWLGAEVHAMSVFATILAL